MGTVITETKGLQSRDKLDGSSLSEVVCLGGSNAVRLGDVLMEMGLNVVKITKP